MYKKPNQQQHQKYTKDIATPQNRFSPVAELTAFLNTPLGKCFSSYITPKGAHFKLSITVVQFMQFICFSNLEHCLFR